jgi:AraC-like DNA-binding protein
LTPALVTDDLPSQDRLQRLAGYLASTAIPLEIRSADTAQIAVHSTVLPVGSVTLARTDAAHLTVVRSPRLARDDSPPQLSLSLITQGTVRFEQYENAAEANAGELVAYWSTAPYTVDMSSRSLSYTVQIRLDRLGLPYSLVRSQLGRIIATGHPLAGVVSSYLLALGDSASRMRPDERTALEQPIIELVRALFCVSAGDEFAQRDPLAQSLGTRIVEHLELHLGDPELSAGSIASAHGISERYVYTILKRLGISLGDWIREHRLAAAAKSLGDPGNVLVSVAALARDAGFTDPAYFARAFRSGYGMSPSDWRHSKLVGA